MRIGPQPYPDRSRSRFQFFENYIPWRILPIPPAPAVVDSVTSQCRIFLEELNRGKFRRTKRVWPDRMRRCGGKRKRDGRLSVRSVRLSLKAEHGEAYSSSN